MPEKSDNQITLFIRDEKTGRYTFNAKALKALGFDPAVARERGYQLKEKSPKSRTSKGAFAWSDHLIFSGFSKDSRKLSLQKIGRPLRSGVASWSIISAATVHHSGVRSMSCMKCPVSGSGRPPMLQIVSKFTN